MDDIQDLGISLDDILSSEEYNFESDKLSLPCADLLNSELLEMGQITKVTTAEDCERIKYLDNFESGSLLSECLPADFILDSLMTVHLDSNIVTDVESVLCGPLDGVTMIEHSMTFDSNKSQSLGPTLTASDWSNEEPFASVMETNEVPSLLCLLESTNYSLFENSNFPNLVSEQLEKSSKGISSKPPFGATDTYINNCDNSSFQLRLTLNDDEPVGPAVKETKKKSSSEIVIKKQLSYHRLNKQRFYQNVKSSKHRGHVVACQPKKRVFSSVNVATQKQHSALRVTSDQPKEGMQKENKMKKFQKGPSSSLNGWLHSYSVNLQTNGNCETELYNKLPDYCLTDALISPSKKKNEERNIRLETLELSRKNYDPSSNIYNKLPDYITDVVNAQPKESCYESKAGEIVDVQKSDFPRHSKRNFDPAGRNAVQRMDCSSPSRNLLLKESLCCVGNVGVDFGTNNTLSNSNIACKLCSDNVTEISKTEAERYCGIKATNQNTSYVTKVFEENSEKLPLDQVDFLHLKGLSTGRKHKLQHSIMKYRNPSRPRKWAELPLSSDSQLCLQCSSAIQVERGMDSKIGHKNPNNSLFSEKCVQFYSYQSVEVGEQRRVVHVGSLHNDASKKELKERFERFGPIRNISLHFREGDGGNFGFITYANSGSANQAIEHGNDDPSQPFYPLCFGGRRSFCKERYSDLDARNERTCKHKCAPVEDFDSLLHEELQKRQSHL